MKFIPATLIVLVVLVSANGIIFQRDGLSSRLGLIANLFETTPYIGLTRNGNPCHNRRLEKSCFFEQPSPTTTLLNIGDSHADVLSSPLFGMAQKRGWSYKQLSYNSCAYIDGVTRFTGGKPHKACNETNKALKLVLENHDPAVIIYVARWIGYNPDWVKTDSKETIESAFRKTLISLLAAGHTLVVVYPGPESFEDLQKIIQGKLKSVPVNERLKAFKRMEVTYDYGEVRERTKIKREMLDSLGEHRRLLRVYPDDIFCSKEKQLCYSHSDEHLYYQDTNHYSRYGAKLVVDEIEKVLDLVIGK